MSFGERFSDVLGTVAEKVEENKYLNSLKNAFAYYLPFILVGSFATLLNTLIASPTTGLAIWIPELASLAPGFTALNFATMTFMTIPIVFLLGLLLGRRNGTQEYATAALAVVAYVTVVPQAVTAAVTDQPDLTASAAGVPATALGAQGLFVGILWTIAITELFRWLASIEALRIKMPASVPPAVSSSFSNLLPVFIVLVISALFGILFRIVTGSYLNEWIYSALQAPLEVVFQSTAGIVLMLMTAQLFWFLGIHGGLVISPIRNPLMAAGIATNVALHNAGDTPTQILTFGFWLVFGVVGGAGMTLGLNIAGMLFSTQQDLKMVCRLGLAPGLFSISEPMVFGVPLVLNPVYVIPFVGNAGLSGFIGVLAHQIGVLTPNVVDVPFGLPILLNAFVSYGWQGIIVQAIIIVVCTLTWIPFVKIDDRRARLERERLAAAEVAS